MRVTVFIFGLIFSTVPSGFILTAEMMSGFALKPANGMFFGSYLALLVLLALVLHRNAELFCFIAGLFVGTAIVFSFIKFGPMTAEGERSAYRHGGNTRSLRISTLQRDELGRPSPRSKEFERQHVVGGLAGRRLSPNHAASRQIYKLATRFEPDLASYNRRASSWTLNVSVKDDRSKELRWTSGGNLSISKGIIEDLRPTDDELAYLMAWGLAHSLWEHERRWEEDKPNWKVIAFNRLAVPELVLKHELEADLIGFEIAARAGFPPQAGLLMWEKLQKAEGIETENLWQGPMGVARLKEVRRNLPAMVKLYEARQR